MQIKKAPTSVDNKTALTNLDKKETPLTKVDNKTAPTNVDNKTTLTNVDKKQH